MKTRSITFHDNDYIKINIYTLHCKICNEL